VRSSSVGAAMGTTRVLPDVPARMRHAAYGAAFAGSVHPLKNDHQWRVSKKARITASPWLKRAWRVSDYFAFIEFRFRGPRSHLEVSSDALAIQRCCRHRH